MYIIANMGIGYVDTPDAPDVHVF